MNELLLTTFLAELRSSEEPSAEEATGIFGLLPMVWLALLSYILATFSWKETRLCLFERVGLDNMALSLADSSGVWDVCRRTGSREDLDVIEVDGELGAEVAVFLLATDVAASD